MNPALTPPRLHASRLATLVVLVVLVASSSILLSSGQTAAAATPTLIGRTSAAGATKALRLPAPSGTAAGDLQVAVVALSAARERVRTPDGWVRLAERRDDGRPYAGGTFRTYVFASTSADPVSFRKSGRRGWQVVRASYAGAAADQVGLAPRRGTTHVAPTVTPEAEDSVVLSGVVTEGVRRVGLRPDEGWQERHNRTATRRAVSVNLADHEVDETLPVSAEFTSARADNSLTFSVVIRRKDRQSPSTSTPTATSTATSTATPTSAPTSTATATPTSAPTSTTTSTPTADPTSVLTGATITDNGGVPWRSGLASDPGYTNHLIPEAPELNSMETSLVRSLPKAMLNISSYAEPIYYSSSSTPMRKVNCVQWGCYGGTMAPIRGDEVVSGGNDYQLNIVDIANRRSYELYDVVVDSDGTVKVGSDGSITVGAMSVVDLDGRGNTTPSGGHLNITGSGVSRIFGVIRAHEVRAAAISPRTAIPHGLQISLPSSMNCSKVFRAPATKTDGRSTSSTCVQEGARVQLDPTFDCSTRTTKMGQAVCYAMQRYGAYVMDNNGSNLIAFYGQHRASWSTGVNDYKAAGITGDYQDLEMPMSRLRVLRAWNGS